MCMLAVCRHKKKYEECKEMRKITDDVCTFVKIRDKVPLSLFVCFKGGEKIEKTEGGTVMV